MSLIELAPPPVSDLPVPLTRFVGRARELAEVARLVTATRLLTLTGAGGSGKTRLAGEAAALVAPHFARVGWVDLAPLTDPTLIGERLATALGLLERPGASPVEVTIEALREHRVLLVLDNCEHLIDAAASLAEALLRTCPGLAILATSREALGVTSETAWLVPPLAGAEAVQLFTDRAQAAHPAFTLTSANADAVAEICRRLDGIPLAIELAAARVRVLPPEQIARRLEDAFRLLSTGSRTALPRHRTLRATMDWSHALLAPREQALLRRLAVFAGRFTLEAAEHVCVGDPLAEDDILDGVATLVEKSLVTMSAGDGEARYRLLETVRQYGCERLAEAGERERFETRHALHYIGLATAGPVHVYQGGFDPARVARLAAEDDDLRAAMTWSVADGARVEHALRLADALFWYWYGSTMLRPGGQYREGRRFVEAALAHAEGRDDLDATILACARSTLGLVGLATGDVATSDAAFTAVLATARQLGDAELLAFALAKLGGTRLFAGDIPGALALLAEGDALVAGMPPSAIHSFVWFWYSWAAHGAGDLATARAVALRLRELGGVLRPELGKTAVSGHARSRLGDIALTEGKLEEAHGHFCEAMDFHLEPLDAWGMMLDVEGFAAITAARSRLTVAARLLGASDALRERAAIAVPAIALLPREQLLARLRAELGDETLARLRAEGGALPVDALVRLCRDDATVHTSEHRVTSAPAPEPANAGPRLHVAALGPLQVRVGDVAVDPAAWGSARPRELLVYLLMHPEGRTKEQVGLAFWPEASAAQLRNNFHVTLHRLRRALGGCEWVELAGERYVIPPAMVATFDVACFERELAEARRAVVRRQEGAAERLERALAHYRGDFLDGEAAGDWQEECRERLRRLHLDGLLALAQQLERAGEPARAAAVLERLLARDALHEEAVQALMRCLAAAGERTQALRAYQRFAARVREELGGAPSAATVRLAEGMRQEARA